MPPTGTTSTRFRKAALSECDRLLRQREKTATKVNRLRASLEAAEDDLHRIDEQVAGLQQLAGAPELEAIPSGDENDLDDSRSLRASAIRETAVQVLLESGRANEPIHYRRWLELLRDAGYEIAGKRPDAVFLNQIVRSPVVRSTTKAGVYELDWEAVERLERELMSLQEDLREATADNRMKPNQLEKLASEIRRTQRSLREAEEAFALMAQEKAAA